MAPTRPSCDACGQLPCSREGIDRCRAHGARGCEELHGVAADLVEISLDALDVVQDAARDLGGDPIRARQRGHGPISLEVGEAFARHLGHMSLDAQADATSLTTYPPWPGLTTGETRVPWADASVCRQRHASDIAHLGG